MGREFQASFRPGFPQDVQRQLLDNSKAQALLGWEPQVPFREGLKEVVARLRRRAVVPGTGRAQE